MTRIISSMTGCNVLLFENDLRATTVETSETKRNSYTLLMDAVTSIALLLRNFSYRHFQDLLPIIGLWNFRVARHWHAPSRAVIRRIVMEVLAVRIAGRLLRLDATDGSHFLGI